MFEQAAAEPSRINRYDHGKEWKREQQVDGFEHLNNPVRPAAIKVIDIQDNSVQHRLVALFELFTLAQ
jgi:hypothetical protein